MSEPLAERMRPHTLADYVGQQHLVGEGAVLRKMIDAGRISSFILWGPPGVGKTTLAQIVAQTIKVPFFTLSAVTSGVKDVREVIERAKSGRFFNSASPILFIDEIHRFSKSQQDSLLGAVEKGIVTLIGATTENPSFEVIRPLLSRCQLYVLKPLEKTDLEGLLHRAITQDVELREKNIKLEETGALLRYSGGDARKLLNILELVVESAGSSEIVITDKMVEEQLQQNPLAYDKQGDMHYDIISAFIKSIRGSDPDAALYWMARMIEGGEDPQFIARRVVISASEDVGLANPNALLLSIAHLYRVDTCSVLSCSLQVVLQPGVVHFAGIPLSYIYTERSILEHALYGVAAILLDFKVGASDVTACILLVVRIEQRCSNLHFTR